MKILIISALYQEYAPLKKIFPAFRPVRKKPSKMFALNLPGVEITLIESGMGEKAVREALGGQKRQPSPDLLIFSGFGGGLHPDLLVGEVCIVTSARPVEVGPTYNFRFSDQLADFLSKHRLKPVLALTAQTPGNKQLLSALACGRPAVLDMETAVAAEQAWSRKIPFLCFRAVSDALDQDLGFNLQDICDEQFRVKPLRVLTTILKRPSTAWAFYRLWRSSSLAAKNLCSLLAAFLDLPADTLGGMAAGIESERK
jgi:adenosylhomocysteine nucleosidase